MKYFLPVLIILLQGCSTSLESYRDEKPEFIMEEFFQGKSIAWGMVQDYNEKVTRRFCVELDSNWQVKADGELQGIIDENFYFLDGEKSNRVWRIKKLQDEHGATVYNGTAGDVSGLAEGVSTGNAFRWQYTLQVPVKQKDGTAEIYNLRVDDWIYLIDKYHAMNRSTLSKLGIVVGEITLFFDRSREQCDREIATLIMQ